MGNKHKSNPIIKSLAKLRRESQLRSGVDLRTRVANTKLTPQQERKKFKNKKITLDE